MVDPISIIVTALATGAAAGLKPTAEKAVKDAYEGLKNLIRKKYGKVNVDIMEGNPTSTDRQNVVTEDLKKTDAGSNEEVLRQAKLVLDLIQKFEPAVAREIGVDIEDLRSRASITIEGISSTGSIKVKKVEADKDITIKTLEAGKDKTPRDPNRQ